MDLESSDVSGGKQNIWSVNINWYPLDIIRISMDYSHTKYYQTENYRDSDSILSMFKVYFYLYLKFNCPGFCEDAFYLNSAANACDFCCA